jgi:lipoprotein-anchoring transpeptidase ErfK/SrfK
MHVRYRLPSVVVAVVAAFLLAGCAPPAMLHHPVTQASHVPTLATPIPTPSAPAPSVVGDAAVATGDRVAVHAAPDGSVTATFANPQGSGAPLTFLVVAERGGWLMVDLPQRPNGSKGWISAASVSLHPLVYSLRASTRDNTLSLYKDSVLVKTYSVATGTGGTPTPHGTFYLTELLQPTNDGYGPYAFGLSAFSEVLSNFGGGPGQIGLHGTDDAGSIGRAASHGCIRMSNTDITALAKLLPLGTPIVIA